MYKFIIIFILFLMSAQFSIADCGVVSGGACSINDLRQQGVQKKIKHPLNLYFENPSVQSLNKKAKKTSPNQKNTRQRLCLHGVCFLPLGVQK